MSYFDDELKKRNIEVPGELIKQFDNLDPFEVLESFFGNEKPTKTEKNAAKLLGGDKPMSFVRALMRGVEPGSSGRVGGFRPKTLAMIQKANRFISQYNMPLTVRQIYYRFVGEGLIENSLKSYKNLASVLAKAREARMIGYDKIVDRTRRAIKPSSWSSPKDFFETVKTAYSRSLVKDQDSYIEVWVEKDALAGVFEPITAEYDVHLVVGRGYPSHSALYEASKRISKHGNKTIQILYYGDFDPSGEDIYRDVQERLEKLFGVYADFTKCALTREDIEKYNLPPVPAKRSDSRALGFIATHGDLAVELDALPPNTLTERVRSSIANLLDLSKYEAQVNQYKEDQTKIEKLVEGLV